MEAGTLPKKSNKNNKHVSKAKNRNQQYWYGGMDSTPPPFRRQDIGCFSILSVSPHLQLDSNEMFCFYKICIKLPFAATKYPHQNILQVNIRKINVVKLIRFMSRSSIFPAMVIDIIHLWAIKFFRGIFLESIPCISV